MEERQEQPVHWDNNRTSFNLTLIFAVIVAVIGVVSLQIPLLLIGLGVAAYSWLTNAKQYLIYRDALVIVYGRPRVKSIPFAQIANLETLTLPMGERLRIRMVNGSRLMLMTKDPETFRMRLDEALNGYHGDEWGSEPVEGTIVSSEQTDDFANRTPPFEGSSDEPAPFDSGGEEDPRGPTTPY